MKIYSLKNKEALDQINKITLNFEARLQDACRHDLEEDGVEVAIYIRRNDLEITEPYNPNGWNSYPAVTPPENVPMILEVIRHTYKGDSYDNFEGRLIRAVFRKYPQIIIEDDGITETKIEDPRWVRADGLDDGQLIEVYGVPQDEKTFIARYRPWPN